MRQGTWMTLSDSKEAGAAEAAHYPPLSSFRSPLVVRFSLKIKMKTGFFCFLLSGGKSIYKQKPVPRGERGEPREKITLTLSLS